VNLEPLSLRLTLGLALKFQLSIKLDLTTFHYNDFFFTNLFPGKLSLTIYILFYTESREDF